MVSLRQRHVSVPTEPDGSASQRSRDPDWYTCLTSPTFIGFLTDPEPITQILARIAGPTSPPLVHPPRGPPETEPGMDLSGWEQDKAAQEPSPDDLDQTPEFDPTEPSPDDDFNQSWEE